MEEDVLELLNGRFLDVEKGNYFEEDTRILIKGKRILHIKDRLKTFDEINSDFTIDLGGRTVIPGLFNTHCHVQLVLPSLLCTVKDMVISSENRLKQIEKTMEDCVRRGITNIRDGWSPDLSMNRYLKERIHRGELLGPRIYESVLLSPVDGAFAPEHKFWEDEVMGLCGFKSLQYKDKSSGVVTFSKEATEEEIRRAVDEAIYERGAQYIKIYDQREKRMTLQPKANMMSINQMSKVVDQCNRRGIRSTIHQLTLESFRRALKVGVHSLVHMPYDGPLETKDLYEFIDTKAILEPTFSMVNYLCFQEDFKYSKSKNSVALSNYRENNSSFNEGEFWLKEIQDAVSRGMEKADKGNFKLFGFKDMKKFFDYYSGTIDYGVDNVKALFEAGALLACGNDSGPLPCTEAMICEELSILKLFLKDKGLREADVIRYATINSAKALGLDGDFGSIAEGKIADLVILEGDVLKDSSIIGKEAKAVFKEGKLLINNCGLQLKRNKI